MKRREFSIAVQLAIVERARDEGERILCERCGIWLKVPQGLGNRSRHLPRALRFPPNDKASPADSRRWAAPVRRRLPQGRRPAEDKANISRAKRVRARGLGLYKPGRIKIARLEKEARKPLKVAPGPPEIGRRFK